MTKIPKEKEILFWKDPEPYTLLAAAEMCFRGTITDVVKSHPMSEVLALLHQQ